MGVVYQTPTVAPEPLIDWKSIRGSVHQNISYLINERTGGCARAHPPGVAPEAGDEPLGSSSVFTLERNYTVFRLPRTLPGNKGGGWSSNPALDGPEDLTPGELITGLFE